MFIIAVILILLFTAINSNALVLTAPNILPAWPRLYRSAILYQGFFQTLNATVAFDFDAKLERFDFIRGSVLPNTSLPGTPTVSHFYNYSAQKQYVVEDDSGRRENEEENDYFRRLQQQFHHSKTKSSKKMIKKERGKKCFAMPMRVFKEILRTPFEMAANATLVPFGDEQIQGEKCWQYSVPVFEDKLYVSLFISSATLLPVRIHTQTLNVTFVNMDTSPFNVTQYFSLSANGVVKESCLAPAAKPFTGTIPGTTNLTFSATEYSKLDPLLWPRASGYQGGDGGQSVVLDSERVYVVADDLFFGLRLHGQRLQLFGMTHNIVILVSGPAATSPHVMDDNRTKVTYHADWINQGGIGLSDFFKPANWSPGARYLWTSAGLMVNNGTTLLMLTMELMGQGKQSLPVMLHVHGVDQPDPQQWRTTFDYSTPFSQNHWNFSAMETNIAGSLLTSSNADGTPDGYIYIPGHTESLLGTRNFHLARAPLRDVVAKNWSQTQYYSAEKGWEREFSLFTTSTLFQSDAPCSTLFYHPGLRLYVALTTNFASIGVAVARNITGPYHAQRVVYEIPPLLSDGYLAYCPSPHMQWSPDPRSIVLTYFEDTYGPNLREKTSSNMYEARFVIVTLEGSF